MPLLRPSLLILLLTVCCHAQALSISVDDTFTRKDIGLGVEYLVDSAGTLTADTAGNQADWQVSTVTALNFGFSTATYWVRFAIRNNGHQPIDLMIESRFPFLDRLDFTVQSSHAPPQHIAVGDILPYSSRPVRHSHV